MVIRGGGGAKFEIKHKNHCFQKRKLVDWGEGASIPIGGQALWDLSLGAGPVQLSHDSFFWIRNFFSCS